MGRIQQLRKLLLDAIQTLLQLAFGCACSLTLTGHFAVFVRLVQNRFDRFLHVFNQGLVDFFAVSVHTMRCAGLDFMVFGEAYLLKQFNMFGEVLELEHLPAINMRVKVDGGFVMLLPDGKEDEFEQDEVVHIKDYDVEQNIYGV